MTEPVAAGLALRSGAPRRSSTRRLLIVGVAALALALVAFASLTLGSRSIPLADVWAALTAPVPGNNDHGVVIDQRLPRTILGLLAGLGLGLSGVLMQGVTRNPLADPGLLGVNAGASLAVVLSIAWFGIRTPAGYVWFALVGAGLAILLVQAIAGRASMQSGPVALAIAGTAVTAVLISLVTVVLLSDISTLSQYRFWSVGSLVGRDLSAVTALWPFLLVGAILAALVAHGLDLLALGDDVAIGLGQRVGLIRAGALAAIVLLAGTATALVGPIVLVGLLVAHIARGLVGAVTGWVLALAGLLGAILLLTADVIGRLVVQPAELEVGIVAAFVGAPVLLLMIQRSRLPGV